MPEKKIPERRCAGCMQSFPKASLIRITASEQGLVIDDQKAPGRGVYLCPRPECARLAEKKNAIARGLKSPVSREDMDRLMKMINEIDLNGDPDGGHADAK